ncbi:hypothetical protein Tco_1314264 [Tanacetum coccineum]
MPLFTKTEGQHQLSERIDRSTFPLLVRHSRLRRPIILSSRRLILVSAIALLKDSDSDVEEDTRCRKEFLANLNLEFHDRTLLSNQKRLYKFSGRERECKLYDAFDKFTHIKGESLHKYYLRFTQLISDMNIYNMKMEQFQVNTKFLNSLPPEWSKFVTNVKLVKDLHTTNFDQLHAYLEQHKLHANELPLVDSGLVVPVFSLGDDPIACLNKAMAFLTVVTSSWFPSTNNQLRTSSNPRNQAIIQDGRVTVQQPKRPRNATWYKDTAMLAEAQEAGQILDEEQLAFLQIQGFQTNAKLVLKENISNYGSDVISEVTQMETYLNDMENQSVDAIQDFKQTSIVDVTDNKITSDSNTIPYSQYLQETQQTNVQDTNLQAQQDSMILSVIEKMSEQMINHVNNWEKANKGQNNESVTADLERYKERKLAMKEQVDSLEQNLSKQIKEKEFFENNDLKAQLQDKDYTICKLKDIIKSTREKSKEENGNYDYEQFDSIKKTRVRTKEQSDSLIDKLNLKSAENEDLKAQIQDKDLMCSSSNYGSKPTCNKKNDRISRKPSRNIKIKVEAQPRKVNKKNRVVEPIRDVDVKHSLLNANSEPICATCKKSMFDGVHDMCLLDFVENVNSRAKSAKKHKKQNIWETYWLSRLFSGLRMFETYDMEPLSAHELSMASEQFSSGPGLHFMTPTTSSSGLIPNTISQQPCIPPTRDDWDHLFQPMFDEYFNPSSIVISPVQEADASRVVVLAKSLVSTSIDQDTPSTSIPSTLKNKKHFSKTFSSFEELPKS